MSDASGGGITQFINDGVLIGTIIGTVILTVLAPRIRRPQRDVAMLPSQVAIAGGAMADTFALEESTKATSKLATAVDRLADVHEEGVEKMRKHVEIMDEMLDQWRDIRRALEDLKPRHDDR